MHTGFVVVLTSSSTRHSSVNKKYFEMTILELMSYQRQSTAAKSISGQKHWWSVIRT